jgi:FhuF-like iron-sulfur protein
VDALREVAGLGPFFTVATDVREPGWQPLAELTEPQALRERVATACAFLAERFRVPPDEIDERAVASMQFLGTAARLLSPALATAVCHGVLPAGGSTHWRPSEGGRVEFALLDSVAQDADAAAFERFVLAGPVAAIEHAVRDEFHLSAHVTRGNVASALAGAVTVLGTERPAAATVAERFARAVLDLDHLAGFGTWPLGGRFRRTNCCLFYRLPGAGKCGDCVLLGGRQS